MTCDPYWNKVVLLLHNEGSNGSTTVLDSSPYAHSVNGADANGHISTAQFYAGAASFFGNGNENVSIPVASEFSIHSGADFTLELRKYDTILVGGTSEIFSLGAANLAPFYLSLNGTGHITAQFRDASFAPIGSGLGPTAVSLNTWHHIAAVLHSGVFTLYLDGVSEISFSLTGTPGPIVDTVINPFGSNNSGPMVDAYVDELRFTNGAARYTTGFTPPTGAFPEVACGPIITVQPADQSVTAPASASFSVTGTSSGGPLLYQWYKNAILIPGATSSSYLTPPTSGTDNGALFTVLLTDNNGTLLSNAATLTVGGIAFNSFLTQFSDSIIFPTTFGKKLGMSEFVFYPMRPNEGGVDLTLSVPNMIINRYRQQPTETRKRGVDFTLFCEVGELITGIGTPVVSPVTSPPLVVTNILIDPDGQKFAYDVSGGVDGTEYQVSFDVSFNTAQNVTEQVIFQIAIFTVDENP